MSAVYAMVMAIALPAALAQSADSVPPCLSKCLQQTTQPCTSASLPALISCINANCIPSDSNNNAGVSDASAAASMALTYTPKIEYSCQQSLVPGSSVGQATPMDLTGDGRCMTSAYDFKSLFVSVPQSTADIVGDVGDPVGTLQKMAKQCEMMLYPEPGCGGKGSKLDLVGVQGEKCIFESGRSARLVCSVTRPTNAQSYASILSTLCTNPAAGIASNGTTSSSSSAPSSSAPSSTAASNSTSGSPYGGSGTNTTLTAPEPTLPSITSQPFTGLANADQVAKPSLIALVALFAVAVMLL